MKILGWGMGTGHEHLRKGLLTTLESNLANNSRRITITALEDSMEGTAPTERDIGIHLLSEWIKEDAL